MAAASIEVREAPLQPWRELSAYEERRGGRADIGATAVFVGSMCDFNEGDTVNGMFLEHYPKMTERQLERLVEEAQARWALLDVLLLHRVGEIRPTDPIVLVAVWSSHRREAFEASRWLMEELKSRAPFWKKEHLAEGGSRWVEKNTPGY